MFNDIKALLKVDEISDAAVVDLYKEASDAIKEDCTLSNNSADLNNLRIFPEQVYVDLKTLVGTDLFKPKAIEKTEEMINLIQKLPESLKIKVEDTSSILDRESIYLA